MADVKIRRQELQGSPEPFHRINRIPIIETGEPLVDIRHTCPFVLLHPGVRPYLRQTVAWMLNRAQEHLPSGYRFAVTTALRTLEDQSSMYWYHYHKLEKERPELPVSAVRRITNKYFAPPDAPAPPGHTTGGAVDLNLIGPDFSTQDVTSPLERWDAAYTWHDTRLNPEARANRAILIRALTQAGFSNCRDEWWHWSYGDSAWAVRVGATVAPYGLREPPAGHNRVADTRVRAVGAGAMRHKRIRERWHGSV